MKKSRIFYGDDIVYRDYLQSIRVQNSFKGGPSDAAHAVNCYFHVGCVLEFLVSFFDNRAKESNPFADFYILSITELCRSCGGPTDN